MNDWILENVMVVSVVLLAGIAATVGLRHRSAALRHWVIAAAVVCACGALPARPIVPTWIDVSAWISRGTIPATARALSAPHAAGGPPAAHQAVTTTAVAVSGSRPFGIAKGSSMWRRLAWMWLIGTVACLSVLLTGIARLRWIASSAEPVCNGDWSALADALRIRYGLRRPIRLLATDQSVGVMAWGWRRPTVVMPKVARSWSRDRIAVVLAHELAHVARRDWCWQLVAGVLRAVYWFNPLAWVAAARLRAESEHACDDSVLEQGVDSTAYAEHLLAIARMLQPGLASRALPASAMARPSQLQWRVKAMLNDHICRRPPSHRARFLAASLFVILTLGISGVRAQTTYYTMAGTVVDTTGRVLPGTVVVLSNPLRETKYEVRTDASGKYEFDGLAQGTYVLTASQLGFATVTIRDVSVAGDLQRDVQMHVSSLEEHIAVSGGVTPPPVDAATLQRREESRRRAAERMQRAFTQCAAAPPTAVGGNILVPTKVVDVRPIYPEPLKAAGLSGTVLMDAIIGTDGLVRDVKNVVGPDPALEGAAADAVRQWEFSPTLLDCDPIEVTMRVTVVFQAQ